VLFFFFSLLQISMAFLLSTVFQNPRTATSFGFVYVFSLSFMSAFLMSNLLDQQSPAAIWLELIPAFSLFRGLYEMSGYAFYASYQGTGGLTFADFSDDANGMPEILIIMTVEFLVFMALAWYLEQVRALVAVFCHSNIRQCHYQWIVA
jgi:ABC-type transport system involved in multi-copper enzyme maturation permease subunit